MRRLVALSLTTVLLASCGGGEDDLAKLQETRDSLKDVRSEISDEIKDIESRIGELDTTKKEHLPQVTSMTLKVQPFEHFFTVQGVVEADQNALVYPEVNGRITSISVKEGEKVSAGQTLMTIDAKIVANQIDEVKSRLSLAEIVYKKQESLWKQEIGSEIQYLEAKNNYESLRQNLETLQAQLAMYTVKAPFNGIVDEITPKVGEMATAMMPAFRLVNMNDVYVKADVAEAYLSKVKSGDSVVVAFPSIGTTINTTIERLGNYINPNNRTFKAKVNLPNDQQVLKPNMLGEVSIRDYHAKNAVVIPSSLVQMTPTGQQFVYIIEGDMAKKVEIQTGMSYNDEIEVTEGLSGNETLINKGARSVKDGDAVEVKS
ncbi:MAG: efflux RND transporter periplasmic adaptor subunit [Flavobacteriales bacterium]